MSLTIFPAIKSIIAPLTKFNLKLLPTTSEAPMIAIIFESILFKLTPKCVLYLFPLFQGHCQNPRKTTETQTNNAAAAAVVG